MLQPDFKKFCWNCNVGGNNDPDLLRAKCMAEGKYEACSSGNSVTGWQELNETTKLSDKLTLFDVCIIATALLSLVNPHSRLLRHYAQERGSDKHAAKWMQTAVGMLGWVTSGDGWCMQAGRWEGSISL